MSERQYGGIYRARVQRVRGHELEVICPAVGSEPLDWARPCFPMLTQNPAVTGVDSGGDSVSLQTETITIRAPKRGAGVWVMFEEGDPDRPVWLGSWMGV